MAFSLPQALSPSSLSHKLLLLPTKPRSGNPTSLLKTNGTAPLRWMEAISIYKVLVRDCLP